MINYSEVYVDGACVNNGKPNAKAGVGVFWGIDHPMNQARPLIGEKQTNIRAELTAVSIALDGAKLMGIKNLLIHSDCQFVIDSLTVWVANWMKNGWLKSDKTPVQNRDLMEEIIGKMKYFNQVNLIKVKAHSGIFGNEKADQLAVMGIES